MTQAALCIFSILPKSLHQKITLSIIFFIDIYHRLFVRNVTEERGGLD